MKKTILLTMLLITAFTCMTQNVDRSYFEKMRSGFQNHKKNVTDNFNNYRDSLNRQYAEYMRQAWIQFKGEPPIPVPERPEPPEPVVFDPEDTTPPTPVPADEIIPPVPPSVVPSPSPVMPDEDVNPNRPSGTFSFDYYGSPINVALDSSHSFALKKIDENAVADQWLKLSGKNYDQLIKDCMYWEKSLNLSDWGFVNFVRKLGSSFFANSSNEAVLLEMFILSQAGYKVRIARSGNSLVLLVPSKELIYDYSYIQKNGLKYYVLSKTNDRGNFNIFDKGFKGEKEFSVRMADEPKLKNNPCKKKEFSSKKYPDLKVEASTNKNLIEFYNDYPRSDVWDVYVDNSLSEGLKKQIFPALRMALEDKTQEQAANILIDFVQTAFDYQTDDLQFGEERPLFGEETFYYPYSDCEDRAILYAALIKELMGLNVVLIEYPGHMATAVRFTEDVSGDYLNVDGEKFVVCDPTFINAPIGRTMPAYKGVGAKVIKI